MSSTGSNFLGTRSSVASNFGCRRVRSAVVPNRGRCMPTLERNRSGDSWIGTRAHQAARTAEDHGTDRGTESGPAGLGTSLQASPRPKALPPTRCLDRAAHWVASIQALAQWRLASVTRNQVIRGVRAGEPYSTNSFDSISEARVFVKAVCGKTARTV